MKMLHAAWAVFEKDWRSEWRTKAGLSTSVLFAVATPIALSFTLVRQKMSPEIVGGLLWTVLLFAALLGLSRAFVKEEENGTAWLLRLHFPPDAIMLGKTLFNFSLLLLMQICAVPLFLILLNVHLTQPVLLLWALLLGDVGLAVASTLLGALAASAKSRGALFAAIAIPVLLPLLVCATTATSACFAVNIEGTYWPAMQIMVGFDLAMAACVWMLFDVAWGS
jgi:heme exporter protein B